MRKSVLLLGLIGLLSILPPSYSPAQSQPRDYLPEAMVDGHLIERWNDQNPNVSIYIEPGDTIPGWRPSMANILESAISEWESVLHGRVHFVYTQDPRLVDVVVRWNANPRGVEVGHQAIQWTDHTLTQSDIDISIVSPQGNLYDDDHLRIIALHEVGHLLGIRGHSPYPGDVMYPALQPGVDHLSQRDINTVNELYRDSPDVTNPEGIRLSDYRVYLNDIRLAYEAHQAKAHEEAYIDFLKAQQIYDKDPHIHYYVGMAAYNAKDYSNAIVNLELAIKNQDEVYYDSQFYLANALMASGANDIQRGHKRDGVAKLQEAKRHYDIVLNSSNCPVSLKQNASSRMIQLVNLPEELR